MYRMSSYSVFRSLKDNEMMNFHFFYLNPKENSIQQGFSFSFGLIQKKQKIKALEKQHSLRAEKYACAAMNKLYFNITPSASNISWDSGCVMASISSLDFPASSA